MSSTDNKMQRLQAVARQYFLCRPWPSGKSDAVHIIMPILHTIALLERAIDADDEMPSADNALQVICELLQPIGRSIPDPQL
jgi:hypothetical protein